MEALGGFASVGNETQRRPLASLPASAILAGMSDEPPKPRPHADPIEIALEGDGPFQLPICTDLKEVALGESLAVLRFETIEGQRVDIPIPIGMLVEIGDAAEQALHEAIRARDGTTLQ